MNHTIRKITGMDALCLMTATAFMTASVMAESANSQSLSVSNTPSKMQHETGNSTGASSDMKQMHMKGMDSMQSMKMSGDPDKDFAMMMKIHHQQALEMAEMEMREGKSPEMKAMAKKIMESQKKEIAQFEKWLAKQ